MPIKPLKAVMAAICVTALLGIPLVLALYLGTPPFKDKRLLTGLFALAAAEKAWAMFFRAPERKALDAGNDWTAATVGAAYIALMYIALIECYTRRAGITCPALAWLGLGIYLAALVLQYSAFAFLKSRWAIHIDQSPAVHGLVQNGPYRFMRHPLYVAYCLEGLSIPLVMQAPWAFAFGLMVFVPLEIQRAVREEGLLRAEFGEEYRAYAARVGFCFSWRGGKRA